MKQRHELQIDSKNECDPKSEEGKYVCANGFRKSLK